MFIIRFLDNRHYIIGPFKSSKEAAEHIKRKQLGGGAVIQPLSEPEK